MSPPRETPGPPAFDSQKRSASVRSLLEAAEKATPGAVTTWIEWPHDDETQVPIIRHIIYEPWAPHHPSVCLDAYTGAVQDVDISMSEPGDEVQRWFGYLHFGNFAGTTSKAVWLFFGLSPTILTITGLAMWWNRSPVETLATCPAIRSIPSDVRAEPDQRA